MHASAAALALWPRRSLSALLLCCVLPLGHALTLAPPLHTAFTDALAPPAALWQQTLAYKPEGSSTLHDARWACCARWARCATPFG